MASESATFDRQDKILELELTGDQENIQSLLLKHSNYDHHIPTSSLGLKCWQEAMDLREPLLSKTPHISFRFLALYKS
ncbi:hypothetical protein DAPPUDRAFT_256514 [Daphnia pulex]|uniref:Uncharacterized protein n=1 Tax=Daphnia pulex TaxID=6669 RepID=E9HBJ2_DAPPU|nr:hypothetical protein DAPPUDRAFT_256514 [Daphnia pulex]|eukprot:EFX70907.1 hypothetical protein DAPPUDRAFT_256514 [Daphnia pulex]